MVMFASLCTLLTEDDITLHLCFYIFIICETFSCSFIASQTAKHSLLNESTDIEAMLLTTFFQHLCGNRNRRSKFVEVFFSG